PGAIMPWTSAGYWLVATALLVQAGAAQKPRPDLRGTQVVGPLGQEIDGLLTRYAEYGLSGTVLVADANRIVLLKGYGFSNRTTHEPNGPQTLFDWGSITKTVTGAAILKLEALGRLRTS